MMRNMRGIGNRINVSLPTDKNGLTSRECPACKGIFKVKFGTGLKGDDLPCHCPYCGHKADMSDFHTTDQIEYAKSVARNQLIKALQNDLRVWGRDLERSTRNSYIKMKVDFHGTPHAIQYYQEKQMETPVICEVCTLEYSIYGVFAFCPDCGTHNSIQILSKNMELVEKEIAFADTVDDSELSTRLLEDALENAVSAFDGFGRATSSAFAGKSSDENQAKEIAFQNIQNARNRIQVLFGFDLGSAITQDEWGTVIRCFQKRHLLAHKMGVIDDDYIKRSKDPRAVVGRKIAITKDEVLELTRVIKIIGDNLFKRLSS